MEANQVTLIGNGTLPKRRLPTKLNNGKLLKDIIYHSKIIAYNFTEIYLARLLLIFQSKFPTSSKRTN